MTELDTQAQVHKTYLYLCEEIYIIYRIYKILRTIIEVITYIT